MESAVVQSKYTPETKRACILFGAALATLAVIFGVTVFHLLDEPIIRVLTVSAYAVMIYNAIAVVLFLLYIPFLNLFLVRHTGYAPFARSDEPLSLKRTLIIFGVAAVSVFVVSACIGFKFKVFYELGQNVAVIQMSAVLVEYVRRLVQLLLSVVFMSLVDEGYRTLCPDGKWPIGGIALVVVYGLIDFFVNRALGVGMFPYIYLIYNAVYALIYYIGGRKVYTTFIPAAVLLVL